MQQRSLLIITSLTLAASAAAANEPWDYRAMIQDGFEGDHFSQSCGLYYRMTEEQRAGGYAFQSNVVRQGKQALKLTVKQHCEPQEEKCSERAEIWEKTASRVPFNEGIWYGISIKFQDPIPKLHHRFVFAQWKRESGTTKMRNVSPYLAFRMKRGKIFATIETNFHPGQLSINNEEIAECANGDAPVWLRPHQKQMRALVAFDTRFQPSDGKRFAACTDKIKLKTYGNKLPDAQSGWIDFAVFSKPGADGDGHMELFANGKHMVTIKGHIGQKAEGLGANQYFKFGLYRDPAPQDWTVYYDNFVRSANCMDVLKDEKACGAIEY